MREKVIAMAMTFDGQRSSCRIDVEKTGQCAKEEVSSSLLGKLAPPFLCYKHIPSIAMFGLVSGIIRGTLCSLCELCSFSFQYRPLCMYLREGHLTFALPPSHALH